MCRTRQPAARHLRRPLDLVGAGPRWLLDPDPRDLRRGRGRSSDAGSDRNRHVHHSLVPRAVAQLCGARVAPPDRHRRRRTGDHRRVAAVGCAVVHLGRTASQGGRCATRSAASGGGEGRRGRCVPAEPARDDGGLPRLRRPGCHLGLVCAGVRRAGRDRPVGSARPQGVAGGRGLRLRREVDRSTTGPGRDPRRTAVDRAHRRVARSGRDRGGRRSDDLERSAGCARRGRDGEGPVRAPSVRAVLERDDRTPQTDRAWSRRHPSRAPEVPRSALGPGTERSVLLVQHDGLDDVEPARLGPARRRDGGVLRRRSGASGPVDPVGVRGAHRRDVLRHECVVPDGRTRPWLHADRDARPVRGAGGGVHRITVGRGRLRVGPRAVRSRRADRVGQRRHRRVLRRGRSRSTRPRLVGRDLVPVPGRCRGGLRHRGTAGRGDPGRTRHH